MRDERSAHMQLINRSSYSCLLPGGNRLNIMSPATLLTIYSLTRFSSPHSLTIISKSSSAFICHSGAPAAQGTAKWSPIPMASGTACGRVRTTTTATESRKMAAKLQLIG